MKNNVSAIVKKFWKHIAVAVASITITVSIGIYIAVSVGVIHIGDINIHTTISQVNNAGNGTYQPNTDSIEQVAIQLEDLEPCTTYEFQASLDPDFKDAETIIFTTECE